MKWVYHNKLYSSCMVIHYSLRSNFTIRVRVQPWNSMHPSWYTASIRVISLRVRNTKIILTHTTSPTSTAMTFCNLVTMRLDRGWHTERLHRPCESGWQLKQSIGNQDQHFNNGHPGVFGLAALPETKKSQFFINLLHASSLSGWKAIFKTSAASNTKNTMTVGWHTL